MPSGETAEANCRPRSGPPDRPARLPVLSSRGEEFVEAFPISDDEDERVIPLLPNPTNIDRYFQKVDLDGEIERRRELFLFLAGFLQVAQISPLRESLSEKEVPYVYPFYCTSSNISLVRAKLESIGLEIVNWPALPKTILEKGVPDFFHNLYLVKFL